MNAIIKRSIFSFGLLLIQGINAENITVNAKDLTGVNLDIQISPTETVKKLARLIRDAYKRKHKKDRYEGAELRITFAGERLDYKKKLSDYGIMNGQTVYFMMRKPGDKMFNLLVRNILSPQVEIRMLVEVSPNTTLKSLKERVKAVLQTTSLPFKDKNFKVLFDNEELTEGTIKSLSEYGITAESQVIIRFDS